MMKNRVLIAILIIFHSVGLVLFISNPASAEFSWFTILLSFVLVFLAESHPKKMLIPFLLIFLGGFLIELIGIQTGILFGDYYYGSALGPKLFGTPIIIGLNWLCIVVSSTSVISKLSAIPLYLKALFSGLLAAALDWLIEPIAIDYHMWNWSSPTIPIWNYVCWFIFSWAFSLLYLNFRPKENKTGTALFVIWTLFFLTLQLVQK